MSQAQNLAKYAKRTLFEQKLTVAASGFTFDVEPDTLYRVAVRAAALADDTLYLQVAPTIGNWASTNYVYQQATASGAVQAAAVNSGSPGVGIAGLDANIAWGVHTEFLFFSGAAGMYPQATLFAGGLDTTGNSRIYQADGVYAAPGAVAQFRLVGTISTNLRAGSRAFLQKLG
jgi:hypothetical protein